MNAVEQAAFRHVFANPVNDFIDGQQACKDGEQCPKGASKDFERGYHLEKMLKGDSDG